MPEGAALSWPLSDIVIRRKNGFDFRCRVRGCSLLDQRPVSTLPRRRRACRRKTENRPEAGVLRPKFELRHLPFLAELERNITRTTFIPIKRSGRG
jgi:hypothetical protein